MSHRDAMSIIHRETGAHFDPILIDMLRDTFEIFEDIAVSQRNSDDLSGFRRGK
jgi:HD-GYP domain-containing protein (c-di-GMP phosphodiesterase class II)